MSIQSHLRDRRLHQKCDIACADCDHYSDCCAVATIEERAHLTAMLEPFMTGVNVSNINPGELADAILCQHRYLQSEFVRLIMATLRQYSTASDNWIDGRNAHEVEQLRRMFALIDKNRDACIYF